eukprot:tig00021531_g22173.t1
MAFVFTATPVGSKSAFGAAVQGREVAVCRKPVERTIRAADGPEPTSAGEELEKLPWNFNKAVGLFKSDLGAITEVVFNRLPNLFGAGRMDYTSQVNEVSAGEFGYVEKKTVVRPTIAPKKRDPEVLSKQIGRVSAGGEPDFLSMARDVKKN